jgi:ankyrin repeat protein
LRAIITTIIGVAMLLTACAQDTPGDIHQAARTGDLERVKTLVAGSPALVDARDANQMTPLHHAARGVHPEVVEFLVEQGADVTLKDANDVTVLHSLAYRGASDLSKLVIANGADVNAKVVTGLAAIHFAVNAGRMEVIEVLVRSGADLELTDNLGSSPLLLAASAGSFGLVERLVELGSDVGRVNARGDTPLTVAHREGHSEIVDLLTTSGADQSLIRDLPVLQGPYLGQDPPGMSPVLFAPGVVSTERAQLNAVFSPDGREFYFTQRTPEGSEIMMMRVEGSTWSRPEPASFTGGLRDVDHFMTRDGERMFFCSCRPIEPRLEAREDADMWVVSRHDHGWGSPEHLGDVVNSDGDDYYPTLTDDGALYFSSRRSGSLGENDVYRSLSVGGIFGEPENLGPAINSEFREFDPFVAPDGGYLIFASNRPGGHGSSDLYISFLSSDGSWTPARNMGPEVNSDTPDFTPMLTPDGRYLFFTSSREGASDLYWVDQQVIEEMRPGRY